MSIFNIEIDQTNKLKEVAKKFTGEILFGVPTSTAYLRNNTDENTQSEQPPYNNAEILALMERGSPVNNIPPRPLLNEVIKKHKDQITQTLQEVCRLLYLRREKSADELMQKLALRIEGWAKKFFTDSDNGWAPNSPITINGGWIRHKNIDGTYGKSFYVKGKGSDRPLIDTGSLRQSIKAIYHKEDK